MLNPVKKMMQLVEITLIGFGILLSLSQSVRILPNHL